MRFRRTELERLRDELAFVCYEANALKTELEAWNRTLNADPAEQTRQSLRRERVEQALARYQQRKAELEKKLASLGELR